MYRQILKAIPRIVGLLFLYTGTYKLLYPGQAATAHETLGLSQGVASAFVVGALISELYLGTTLLLSIDLRFAIGASMVLMLLFTGYMFYLSTLAHPPSCGCLGLTGIFTSSKHAALFGLFRNCAILWALKFACDGCPPGRAPTPIAEGAAA
jgi:hypothetical protein